MFSFGKSYWWVGGSRLARNMTEDVVWLFMACKREFMDNRCRFHGWVMINLSLLSRQQRLTIMIELNNNFLHHILVVQRHSLKRLAKSKILKTRKLPLLSFLSNHGSSGLNSLEFYDWEFALKPWIQFAISWSSHILIGMPFVYLHFSVPSSLPRKAALWIPIHQGGGVRGEDVLLRIVHRSLWVFILRMHEFLSALAK